MIPKISIIVPIYNVEKYLKRSIESILGQTISDIEIILVNDGSIDNSLSICREYQKIDKRIQVINKTNGGVSSARNAGLEVAKGEYIGFIDPDDWIEPNMYENLYNQVKKDNAEICMCNFIIENNGKRTRNLLNIEQDLLKGKEIVNQIVANMIGSSSLNSGVLPMMGSVCRLIIKKEFIRQYNFKFELGIPLMEDLIFCIQVFLKSRRVSINTGFYYHYITNSNSAVTMYRENMAILQLKVFKALENLLNDETIDPIVQKRLNVRYVNIIISAIANEALKTNRKSIREKIIYIKKLSEDKRVKNILKGINTRGYTLRKKIVLNAIKYEMGIFLYIYFCFLVRVYNK